MTGHKYAIIDEVRQELARHDKPENKHNYQRFFKEPLKEPWGLKSAILRKISNQCFRKIRGLPKQDVLNVCDEMLKSEERYFGFFAFDWAGKVSKLFSKSDIKRFESWLKKHVHNWGSCDHICTGVIGPLVSQFPETVATTGKWTKSKNRWVRRAAAVSLIVPVRKRLLLAEVFETADILLTDPDDMVQKGYGWMLKEASNEFPDEVFRYVMKNKASMPRTALRYAIEKLPHQKRRKAMAKDW